MCLDPHIERVIRELDHLNDMSVRGLSGEHHAVRCKVITVVIVDLKTMSVALVDHICSVEGICFRLFIKDTRIGAETKRSAKVLHAVLIRHQIDNRMGCLRIQLGTVCIRIAENISRKCHHGHLHAEADPEERDLVLSRIVCSQDHAFGSSGAKTARDDDAVNTGECIVESFRF